METPKTAADVSKILWLIKQQTKKIEQLTKDWGEMDQFYRETINKREKQVEFLQGKIMEFLANNDRTAIALPEGTCYINNRTYPVWPKDTKLLEEFAEKNNLGQTEVVRKGIRSAIKKYVTETGDTPPWWSVDSTSSLVIREPGDNPNEEDWP